MRDRRCKLRRKKSSPMGNSLSSECNEKLAKVTEDVIVVKKLLKIACEREDRKKADMEWELAAYRQIKADMERELAAYRQMDNNRGNHLLECPICLTNRKDLAFGCGHLTCGECGSKVSNCPVCRVQITSRLKIYIE